MTPERIAALVARWVRFYTQDLPTPRPTAWMTSGVTLLSRAIGPVSWLPSR